MEPVICPRGLRKTYRTLSTAPCLSLYVSPDCMTCCGLPPSHPSPWLGDPHKEWKDLPCRSPSHEEVQDMVKDKGITRACPLCIPLSEPYQRWLVENYDWRFLISFCIRIMTSSKNNIWRASSLENQYRAHTPSIVHLSLHLSMA